MVRGSKSNNQHLRRIMKSKVLLLVLLLPVVAHAHPGHAGHEGDIGWGLAHPFTGFDHLLAALAVGLWAGLQKGASRVLPLGVFLGGAIMGMAGGYATGSFTGLETALAATVLLFGASLAGGFRLSGPLACAVAGACAFVHGWAHGAEAPVSGSMAALTGVTLGTALICGIGLGAAVILRARHTVLVRGIGAATTVIAAVMLARSF
jgi:urease accessory protein